jgi:hypothetical protein
MTTAANAIQMKVGLQRRGPRNMNGKSLAKAAEAARIQMYFRESSGADRP